MKETDSKKKRREIRKRRRIRLEEKKREKIGKIPAEERKFFLKISSKPRYKIAAVAIVIILISCGLFYYFQQPADVPAPSMVFGDGISPFKAAIIDHLSLLMPNQAFVDTSINILQEAGFTIDYYEGDRVTVELYRSLPTHHYDLIILRVHSSATELRGEEFVEGNVIFFTSEPYSTTKYVYEQSTGQLGKCAFNTPNSIYYFSIPPKFVASSMEGKFNNTVIIMMGCEGLSNTIMAEAFIEKDAKAYTGWDAICLMDTEPGFGWENFTCTVTDNVAVDKVKLVLIGNTTTEYPMNKDGDDYYCNITITPGDEYTYHIWANDTSGNVATSTPQVFRLYPNWDVYRYKHRDELRTVEIEEVEKMLRCEDLGYRLYCCPGCGELKVVHFGCNSRVCTHCGKKFTDKWADSISRKTFDVKRRHVVLTSFGKICEIFK